MRIGSDRGGDAQRASSSAATLAEQTSANQPAVLSFAAALQKHRQSPSPRAKESADSNDTSARRSSQPTRRASSRNDENRSTATDSSKSDASPATAVSSLEAATTTRPQPMLTLLFGAGAGAGTAENSSQAAAAAAATPHLQRLRRIRDAFGANAPPCIEFSHSETGTRFRLSRDNGVWLLSIQSRQSTTEADVQSLIEGLRSHFNASGLGALDVICVD